MRRLRASIASLLALALGCGAEPDPSRAAIEPLLATELAPIVASPASFLYDPNGNGFGGALALTPDAGRLVVGSEWDYGADAEPYGAVRIYARSGTTWIEEAVLRDAVQNNSDRFGMSVAITPDSSRIVVGVGQDTTAVGQASGSVRVFVRSGATWVVEATLMNSDLTSFDALGTAVAVSADGSRIGATILGDPGGRGVRVFSRSGSVWTHEAALTVRGTTLAMSADGTRLFVGTPGDGTRGANAGAASVYRRSATVWTLESTLYSPESATNERFGTAVSLSSDGTRALVGANLDDAGTVADAGAAHVFVRAASGTTWAHEAALRAADAATSDELGTSVALSPDGTRAFVGALLDDVGAVANAGSVRVFVRSGTAWAEDATLTASAGTAIDEFGRAIATDSAGGLALVGAPRDELSTRWVREGSVRVFSLALTAVGGACGGAAACASGFCVDGVCCATACGGGNATDCEACSAALTGAADGSCAPLSASIAPTVTCRPVADACDVAEACEAGTAACPSDRFVGTGTECRARTDACDRPEACTGLGPACPVDAGLEPAGTACRVALPGTCDATEVCTGASAACPGDGLLPSGAVCRPSAGPCDGAERCDGFALACPGDAFEPAGTVCRARGGPCDLTDVCTGTSAACPADQVRPAGTLCALGDPTIACDADDVCDGATIGCPATFAPAGTECAPSSGEACDAPDRCAGGSADCVRAYLAGVVCRPSLGACDPEEACAGTSAYCPPDVRTAAGRSCRATTASCDPEEVCDGASAVCPADVVMCGPAPDAGEDDAGPGPSDAGERDAGAAWSDVGAPTADAGATALAVAGCACRASAAPRAPTALGLALALALAARDRSHRRRR